MTSSILGGIVTCYLRSHMLLIIRGDGDGDMDCIGDQEPYAKDNHANQRAPEAANRIFIFVLLNINIAISA